MQLRLMETRAMPPFLITDGAHSFLPSNQTNSLTATLLSARRHQRPLCPSQQQQLQRSSQIGRRLATPEVPSSISAGIPFRASLLLQPLLLQPQLLLSLLLPLGSLLEVRVAAVQPARPRFLSPILRQQLETSLHQGFSRSDRRPNRVLFLLDPPILHSSQSSRRDLVP